MGRIQGGWGDLMQLAKIDSWVSIIDRAQRILPKMGMGSPLMLNEGYLMEYKGIKPPP